jgi:hypothetical protein
MNIELVSVRSGLCFRLDGRSYGKLLHLARFHGWQPERLSEPPPPESADTVIVMRHVQPYMMCGVSETDAGSLLLALRRMIASEAAVFEPVLHFAALGMARVAQEGAFEVLVQETPTSAVSGTVSCAGPV